MIRLIHLIGQALLLGAAIRLGDGTTSARLAAMCLGWAAVVWAYEEGRQLGLRSARP